MWYPGLLCGKALCIFLRHSQELEVLVKQQQKVLSKICHVCSQMIICQKQNDFFPPWLSYFPSYLCFLLAGSGTSSCQGMCAISAQSELLPENCSIRSATPRNPDLQKKDCWLHLFLIPPGLSTANSVPFLISVLLWKARSSLWSGTMKPN